MRMFGTYQASRRRSVPRTQAPSTVVLSVPAGDYVAALVDISRTGARLRGDVLPLAGQRVTFRAQNVHVAADVVWHELGACAVEFDMPIAACEVQRLRWPDDAE